MSLPSVGCVILGGGGHARVLVECIQQMEQQVALLAVLDMDTSRWGNLLAGVPIRGGDELLPMLISEGAHYFIVGLGGVGDNRPRQKLYELGIAHGLEPFSVIHPRAYYSTSATLGAGVQLLPGSIVNSGAVLGNNVIVNSGAIVEHDCVIADHVHIATGAKLASTIQVGAGAHIGIGATIRQCLQIGEGVLVGAGAVVVRDVPANTVVAGVPAKILREIRRE